MKQLKMLNIVLNVVIKLTKVQLLALCVEIISNRGEYEKILRSVGTFRICCDDAFGHTFALSLRMAWKGGVDCALLGSQRVHLGAYEASLLAHAAFRLGRKLFPS